MAAIKAKHEIISDKENNPVTSTEYIKHGEEWLDEVIDGKASTDYVNDAISNVESSMATLGPDGKVPASQLPSYVDDVLEFAKKSDFPAVGEEGKIYVDKSTNLTWRWSGSTYVEISQSLALGETSSTAYAGNKGKQVADNLAAHTGNTTVHITAAEREKWNNSADVSKIPKMPVTTDKTFESEEGYCYVTDWTKNLVNLSLDYLKKINTGGKWNGNVYTWRGISFTINNDGTVTMNGNNTSLSSAKLYLTPSISTETVFYYRGNPIEASKISVGISIDYSDESGWKSTPYDYGEGIITTQRYPFMTLMIAVSKGKIVDNITVRPLIIKGSNPHPYIPNVGNKIVVCGKNLFDRTKKTSGYYINSNGELVKSGSSDVSDFIYVFGRANVTISANSTDSGRRQICFYDDNKQYIANSYVNYTSGGKTFNIPEGAVYARFSYLSENESIVQLEFGTEMTEYVSYIEKEYPVTNDMRTFIIQTYYPITNIIYPADIEIIRADNAQARLISEEFNNIETSGNELLDKAECAVFAHHITGGSTPQGFCTYKYNNINYCACAAAMNDNTDVSNITIYNLSTGEKVTTITSEYFGHLNDITYYDGAIYAVNESSSSEVLIINLESYETEKIDIVGYNGEGLHGIEYFNGNFYILTTSLTLCKFNVELTKVLYARKIEKSEGFNTTQGIFAYGGYIFFIHGQNDRSLLRPYVNSMQVYRIDDFSPIKTMYVPYGTELEGVGYVDGDFYFYYNDTSSVGMIFKGTILKGEKIYGVENLGSLIGLGRFEKSVPIYIDENYTGFFVDNTPEKPFHRWTEANVIMINENTPRYNIYFLSDVSSEMTCHPTFNSYVYIYGSQYSNGQVSNKLRTMSKKFALANGSLMSVNYMEFTGNYDMPIERCKIVEFHNCKINRSSKPSISECETVKFDSTSIEQEITVSYASNIYIGGNYTAADACINSNRLINGLRITDLPTNKTDGWNPLKTSATGTVYAGTVEICKKLLNYNLLSGDIKTLSDSDVVADLNLRGRYMAVSGNTIADVPNHNGAMIELEKGYSNVIKIFTFSNTASSKVYRRTIHEDSGFDSGWVKVISDINPNISLFEKIGVIGDSFCSGETYTTGHSVDNYNVSWLQIMARQNGFTGTNYSKGGLTSQTWLTDTDRGLPSLQSSEAENLYLIALGINDSNRMTLGTPADIGNETKTTFYACYSRIINAVKAKNSKAKIICFSPARFGGNYDTFKEAIKVIAETLNVPYVDITSHPYFKTAFFSDNQVSNHPTALNYGAMANAYKELIEKCMIDRQGYFNDYM